MGLVGTERGHRVNGFQKLAPTTRRMGSDHISVPEKPGSSTHIPPSPTGSC